MKISSVTLVKLIMKNLLLTNVPSLHLVLLVLTKNDIFLELDTFSTLQDCNDMKCLIYCSNILKKQIGFMIVALY